ncbi:hypothetical protein TSAR_006460 [Trichomalopsis sarcophagae]|uniref:Uncharacterized protein n=1 Tax=Trichomalopsis sarcophagae TaxID=543379 RepID=A0A232EQM8_9HYME|nr:hypothetical protein TSAR_006460 [Trichomalopsis sarcophagae]
MSVWMCVYVYRNISGTTRSISIKFDMHVYFWILNSGKTFIFYYCNYFFYGQFLIFEKHYFAFFSIIPLKRIKLPTFFRLSSGSTALFGR